MKNLKVATKLIISFGVVIIMTIACSLVSVIGLKSVHGNVNLMIDTEIKSLLSQGCRDTGRDHRQNRSRGCA